MRSMNCDLAQTWLLNADAPADYPAGAAEIAEHVRGCGQCQKLAQDVVRLEQLWRDRPLPGRAETSKAGFLVRLQQLPAPASEKPKAHRWSALRYWAAAALLFIVLGGGFLFFGPGRHAEARPDVIEQLIDWNLDLSEAPAADRERIFSARQESLQKSVGAAQLGQSDRALAQELLANGSWLAHHQDPVEELQRFNTMADELLEQVRTSDVVRADRFARQFRKVNERAIDPAMERVRAIAAADPERRKLINRILKHDKERAAQIYEILERSPDITKKELRQALDMAQKRHKHKKE
jgi:hypothetical protein